MLHVAVLAGLMMASPVSGPVATATPATELSNGSTVAVTLSGFPADTMVRIAQCTLVDQQVVCNENSYQDVVTSDDGTASTNIIVLRSFGGKTTTGEDAGQVDCNSVAFGCVVGGATADFSSQASTPISFMTETA